MTVYAQPVHSYSDTTPHIRVISNIIQLIDPVDTPVLDVLGGLDRARDLFRVKLNGTKIELLEDEYEPLELAGGVASGWAVDPAALTFTATAQGAIAVQDGSVLLVEAEYVVVKSVNLSTNVVTVYARDYGGTNATHANGTAFSIVGMARLTGDDADFGPIVDIVAPFNHTSIFQKAIQVSGTLQAIDQYGIPDEFDYQANKVIPEKLRLVERMVFHGIRSAGSASAPRSAGGLNTFITTNVTAVGGAITKAVVDTLATDIHMEGGAPDLLIVNPRIGRRLKDLVDSSTFVRLDYSNTQVGMAPIVRVSTQYGDLRLVMSRWCPLARAYMLQSNKVGLYTLRPFASKRLAVIGDSVRGEVVAELSLLLANENAHGQLTGLTDA